MCGACYAAWNLARNPELKKRQQESSNRWAKENRDKTASNSRKYRKNLDPLVKRERLLLKKYGLTLEGYNNILLAQGGGCAICNRKPGERPLHVDHDHRTDRIRGLLCHQCNWYLGTIDADPDIIQRIIRYRRTPNV